MTRSGDVPVVGVARSGGSSGHDDTSQHPHLGQGGDRRTSRRPGRAHVVDGDHGALDREVTARHEGHVGLPFGAGPPGLGRAGWTAQGRSHGQPETPGDGTGQQLGLVESPVAAVAGRRGQPREPVGVPALDLVGHDGSHQVSDRTHEAAPVAELQRLDDLGADAGVGERPGDPANPADACRGWRFQPSSAGRAQRRTRTGADGASAPEQGHAAEGTNDR